MAIKYASMPLSFEFADWSISNYWPSKNMIKMAIDMFQCIWFIWWCIFVFPSCCYSANSFSRVCFSTATKSFINFTSWMDTGIFKFKKSFDFSSEPFYSDVVFIISKFVKLFDKLFTYFLEYGISIKRTGGLTSKKYGGIIKSMFLWLFSLFRKSLHTLFINLDGKLAARKFLGISKKWYLHSYWG